MPHSPQTMTDMVKVCVDLSLIHPNPSDFNQLTAYTECQHFEGMNIDSCVHVDFSMTAYQ